MLTRNNEKYGSNTLKNCLFYCTSLIVLLGLLGCEQGVTEQWCDAMVEKPNKEWTDADTRTFAKHCLYE